MDEAYASLSAAIEAVQKNLENVKADLEAADANNKAALDTKDAELEKFIIIVCAIASVTFVGIGAFVIWFFVNKKKRS